MDVVLYASSGALGHVGDDLRTLGRAVTGFVSADQALALRRYYGWSYVRKTVLYFPEEVYRFTRLFIAAALCYLASSCGRRQLARRVKARVNDEAINLAAHSVEITIFQIGWLHGRTGLALHTVGRLAYRGLGAWNRLTQRFWGFGGVETGSQLPIDLNCLQMALWTRIRRVYRYVKLIFAGLLLTLSSLCAVEYFKVQLLEAVKDGAYLVRDKMDIPRYDLGMAFPGFAHSRCWLVIGAIRGLAVKILRSQL